MKQEKKLFTDQLGRQLKIQWPPKRIVSLVPSQTELLYTLGLEEQVVGITKFCVHPPQWHAKKTQVGGTKTPKSDRIRQLQPDLIIGNKEENEKSSIEALASEFPVWMSDIYSLADSLQMMRMLGQLTNTEAAASQLADTVESRFRELPKLSTGLRVLYLIWRNPWMAAGSNTFIHHMLDLCGYSNAAADLDRYPELSPEDLRRLSPAVVLLSSEPYPFQEKHFEELQSLLPQSKLLLVDGELFSWYGSRLLEAPAYFQELQHQVIGR